MSQPLSSEEFKDLFSPFFSDQKAVAVAVSGGPDSLALWHGLSLVSGLEVHPLLVDHGLREDSAREAEHVKSIIPDLKILKWEGEKPEAALQEEARRARYALMTGYCRDHGVSHLFLAHHLDDQAETVLFRLAKGSGLDGLSGMKPQQGFEDLTLCRPFLGIEKARLIATCEAANLPYVEDLSNENGDFARVRLRQARDVLEEEGLSNKRLAVTAGRLMRVREALEDMADKAYHDALIDKHTDRIEFNFEALQHHHEEIVLRCVLKALNDLRPDADYAPRMEKVEALIDDLLNQDIFRKRTLGGVVFEVRAKDNVFIMMHEKP